MRTAIVTLAALFAILAGAAFAPQDGEVTTLSDLTVAAGEAPPPAVGNGAPNYSVEQVQSALCAAEAQGASRVDRAPIERALGATIAARQSRLDLKAGRITAREAETAELARQAAVRPIGQAGVRRDRLDDPEKDGLVVEGVRPRREIENGRRVLIVTGAVRNTTAKDADLPALTVWTLDARDFVLAAQTYDLGRETLGAGERLAFELRFKNPPEYTAAVHANFAPPFQIRTLRACDLDGRAAAPGDGPDYTPAEVAGLAQTAFIDASIAFAEAEIRKKPGGGNRERPARCDMPGWRELLVYADLMEEAAFATRAAAEARRDAGRGVFTAAEVEAAEAAAKAALDKALAARPPLRGEKAGEARGVRVRIEEEGSKVNLRGEAREHDPIILLTVRDRFGRVASERYVRFDLEGFARTTAGTPSGRFPFDWDVHFAPGLAREVAIGAC